MNKRHFIESIVSAAVLAFGLSACSGDDDAMTAGDEVRTPEVIYRLSVPASFNAEGSAGDHARNQVFADGTTRAVEFVTDGGKTTCNSIFKEGDDIYPYLSPESGVYVNNYEYSSLKPTAISGDKTSATLTGTLKFDGTNVTVNKGDDIRLFYQTSYDGVANYLGQTGTQESVSEKDFSVANVKVSSVKGDNTNGFTVTTTQANFENLQSIFRFRIAGLDNGEYIQHLNIHSGGDKLLTRYSLLGKSDDTTYGDILITPAANTITNGSDLYAALRFDSDAGTATTPDGSSSGTINFTAIGSDGKVYEASRTSTPANGMYYGTTLTFSKSDKTAFAISGGTVSQSGVYYTLSQLNSSYTASGYGFGNISFGNTGITLELSGVTLNSGNVAAITVTNSPTITLSGINTLEGQGEGITVSSDVTINVNSNDTTNGTSTLTVNSKEGISVSNGSTLTLDAGTLTGTVIVKSKCSFKVKSGATFTGTVKDSDGNAPTKTDSDGYTVYSAS